MKKLKILTLLLISAFSCKKENIEKTDKEGRRIVYNLTSSLEFGSMYCNIYQRQSSTRDQKRTCLLKSKEPSCVRLNFFDMANWEINQVIYQDTTFNISSDTKVILTSRIISLNSYDVLDKRPLEVKQKLLCRGENL